MSVLLTKQETRDELKTNRAATEMTFLGCLHNPRCVCYNVARCAVEKVQCRLQQKG